MPLRAAFAHANAQAHHRVSVNASQPFGGTDAGTLGQGTNRRNLPIEGKDVYGAEPQRWGIGQRLENGSSLTKMLCSIWWS